TINVHQVAPPGPVPLGAGVRRSRRPARRAEAQTEGPLACPGPQFKLHAVPGFSLAWPYTPRPARLPGPLARNFMPCQASAWLGRTTPGPARLPGPLARNFMPCQASAWRVRGRERLLGGSLEALAVARVHVVHEGEVVHGDAELQSRGQAPDDVACAARDDVDAEDAPCLSVEHDLEETVLRADVLSARHRRQRMLHDVHVEALL